MLNNSLNNTYSNNSFSYNQYLNQNAYFNLNDRPILLNIIAIEEEGELYITKDYHEENEFNNINNVNYNFNNYFLSINNKLLLNNYNGITNNELNNQSYYHKLYSNINYNNNDKDSSAIIKIELELIRKFHYPIKNIELLRYIFKDNVLVLDDASSITSKVFYVLIIFTINSANIGIISTNESKSLEKFNNLVKTCNFEIAYSINNNDFYNFRYANIYNNNGLNNFYHYCLNKNTLKISNSICFIDKKLKLYVTKIKQFNIDNNYDNIESTNNAYNQLISDSSNKKFNNESIKNNKNNNKFIESKSVYDIREIIEHSIVNLSDNNNNNNNKKLTHIDIINSLVDIKLFGDLCYIIFKFCIYLVNIENGKVLQMWRSSYKDNIFIDIEVIEFENNNNNDINQEKSIYKNKQIYLSKLTKNIKYDNVFDSPILNIAYNNLINNEIVKKKALNQNYITTRKSNYFYLVQNINKNKIMISKISSNFDKKIIEQDKKKLCLRITNTKNNISYKSKELNKLKNVSNNNINTSIDEEDLIKYKNILIKIIIDNENKCFICKQNSSLRCGNCKKIYYCEKNHQAQHWSEHIDDCSLMREITNLDIENNKVNNNNNNSQLKPTNNINIKNLNNSVEEIIDSSSSSDENNKIIEFISSEKSNIIKKEIFYLLSKKEKHFEKYIYYHINSSNTISNFDFKNINFNLKENFRFKELYKYSEDIINKCYMYIEENLNRLNSIPLNLINNIIFDPTIDQNYKKPCLIDIENLLNFYLLKEEYICGFLLLIKEYISKNILNFVEAKRLLNKIMDNSILNRYSNGYSDINKKNCLVTIVYNFILYLKSTNFIMNEDNDVDNNELENILSNNSGLLINYNDLSKKNTINTNNYNKKSFEYDNSSKLNNSLYSKYKISNKEAECSYKYNTKSYELKNNKFKFNSNIDLNNNNNISKRNFNRYSHSNDSIFAFKKSNKYKINRYRIVNAMKHSKKSSITSNENSDQQNTVYVNKLLNIDNDKNYIKNNSILAYKFNSIYSNNVINYEDNIEAISNFCNDIDNNNNNNNELNIKNNENYSTLFYLQKYKKTLNKELDEQKQKEQVVLNKTKEYYIKFIRLLGTIGKLYYYIGEFNSYLKVAIVIVEIVESLYADYASNYNYKNNSNCLLIIIKAYFNLASIYFEFNNLTKSSCVYKEIINIIYNYIDLNTSKNNKCKKITFYLVLSLYNYSIINYIAGEYNISKNNLEKAIRILIEEDIINIYTNNMTDSNNKILLIINSVTKNKNNNIANNNSNYKKSFNLEQSLDSKKDRNTDTLNKDLLDTYRAIINNNNKNVVLLNLMIPKIHLILCEIELDFNNLEYSYNQLEKSINEIDISLNKINYILNQNRMHLKELDLIEKKAYVLALVLSKRIKHERFNNKNINNDLNIFNNERRDSIKSNNSLNIKIDDIIESYDNKYNNKSNNKSNDIFDSYTNTGKYSIFKESKFNNCLSVKNKLYNLLATQISNYNNSKFNNNYVNEVDVIQLEKLFLFIVKLNPSHIKILNETQDNIDKVYNLPILFNDKFKSTLNFNLRIELESIKLMSLRRCNILINPYEDICIENLDINPIKKYYFNVNKSNNYFLNKINSNIDNSNNKNNHYSNYFYNNKYIQNEDKNNYNESNKYSFIRNLITEMKLKDKELQIINVLEKKNKLQNNKIRKERILNNKQEEDDIVQLASRINILVYNKRIDYETNILKILQSIESLSVEKIDMIEDLKNSSGEEYIKILNINVLEKIILDIKLINNIQEKSILKNYRQEIVKYAKQLEYYNLVNETKLKKILLNLQKNELDILSKDTSIFLSFIENGGIKGTDNNDIESEEVEESKSEIKSKYSSIKEEEKHVSGSDSEEEVNIEKKNIPQFFSYQKENI